VYEVILTSKAEKQLGWLSGNAFARVDQTIRQLANNPRPYGVKKLRDRVHRVRIGNYRIIYSIFDDDRVVLVSKVARRSETTYRGI